jgi:Ulp1 family protease
VEAAMKNFSSVITVINHPQYHWVTLQFSPKREVLEVFDSMSSQHVELQMEKIRKVRSPRRLMAISDALNNK